MRAHLGPVDRCVALVCNQAFTPAMCLPRGGQDAWCLWDYQCEEELACAAGRCSL